LFRLALVTGGYVRLQILGKLVQLRLGQIWLRHVTQSLDKLVQVKTGKAG